MLVRDTSAWPGVRPPTMFHSPLAAAFDLRALRAVPRRVAGRLSPYRHGRTGSIPGRIAFVGESLRGVSRAGMFYLRWTMSRSS